MRAHGTKRLLPFFTGVQLSRIDVASVREWRAEMLEAVEAGDWAPKTVNNARIALLGCLRMAVADGLMAHNPVLDVRPLTIEFTELIAPPFACLLPGQPCITLDLSLSMITASLHVVCGRALGTRLLHPVVLVMARGACVVGLGRRGELSPRPK